MSPIYDFYCASCNKKEERILSIKESNEQYCKICKRKIEKVPSNFSFDLQGKGWSKPGFTGK